MMALYFWKTFTTNLTLILMLWLSLLENQINCEVTVFKGDPIRPKAINPEDIRRLNFVNRPRQPRQDDGDDGGEEETTMMPGLGAVLSNLFGSMSALAQFPQIIRTFSQIGTALNSALGGNANSNGGGGLPNFLVRQSNQSTPNIFQQITGQGGQGPQSILQILEQNRRPIGGVIPNNGRPGAANGALGQEQMELLLMAMMMMQSQQGGGVQGASGVNGPASGQAVGAPSVNPDLQNQLVKLAIQQQMQQLLNMPGVGAPVEDYSVEDFGQPQVPTEDPVNRPTAPPRAPAASTRAPVASSAPVAPSAPVVAPVAPSAPVVAPSAPAVAPSTPLVATSAPTPRPRPSAAAPQINKEIAQLASKLPAQSISSAESDIIPNLWELYAQLQMLPQFQPTPSPANSPSPPTTPSPINLTLFQEAISQYPALFSLALLQSLNAASQITQNQAQIKPQQQVTPQKQPPRRRKPSTPSPFSEPTQPPIQTPSWTYPPANKPYAPNNSPAYPSTNFEEPEAPPPPPVRRPTPTAPPPFEYHTTPYPSPENTHIYQGSLNALKAQSLNQRPEETPSNQGPHFVKSPTSSQLTLPISGYVPSVVSVFEGVDSQKPVGPQPDIYDEFNGFGHKAPYSPIIKGVIIDTPRLPHSPHDLVRRPSSGLVVNTEGNSQKLPEFSFQANKVNNVVRQPPQLQQLSNNNYEYGPVHTTTTTTTTRRPTTPPPPPPPQRQQAPNSPSLSSSWIAAIKEVQWTTAKPTRNRTRPTTKKPSLLNGPIYWMNMFYPKGTSTQKSSIYKFER